MKIKNIVLTALCSTLLAYNFVQTQNNSDFQETKILAEQGFAKAQYNLALMYCNGQGVKQDNIMAYAWASKALVQGESDAKKLIKYLENKMTSEQIRKAQSINPFTYGK